MTERIDHAAEARMHIDWAHEHQEHEGITERTVTDTALLAQAEATLALVEQQRIQNLIALQTPYKLPNSAEVSTSVYDIEMNDGLLTRCTLKPHIAAALGIEEVQS